MYQITQITSATSQTQALTLPDGSQITFDIAFYPLQQGWFFDVTYGTFVLKGVRVTASPNMLRQWRYQIPFGLGCNTFLTREPNQQQDFVSNAFQLYVLSQQDVDEYETYLKTEAP